MLSLRVTSPRKYAPVQIILLWGTIAVVFVVWGLLLTGKAGSKLQSLSEFESSSSEVDGTVSSHVLEELAVPNGGSGRVNFRYLLYCRLEQPDNSTTPENRIVKGWLEVDQPTFLSFEDKLDNGPIAATFLYSSPADWDLSQNVATQRTSLSSAYRTGLWMFGLAAFMALPCTIHYLWDISRKAVHPHVKKQPESKRVSPYSTAIVKD